MDNCPDEAELFQKLATAIGTTSEDVYSLHETERNQLLVATGLKNEDSSKQCTKNSKWLREEEFHHSGSLFSSKSDFDDVPSSHSHLVEEDSLGFDLGKAMTNSRRSSLRRKIRSSTKNSPSTSSSRITLRLDPRDKKEIKEIDLAKQVSIVEQINANITKSSSTLQVSSLVKTLFSHRILKEDLPHMDQLPLIDMSRFHEKCRYYEDNSHDIDYKIKSRVTSLMSELTCIKNKGIYHSGKIENSGLSWQNVFDNSISERLRRKSSIDRSDITSDFDQLMLETNGSKESKPKRKRFFIDDSDSDEEWTPKTDEGHHRSKFRKGGGN